MLRKKEHKHEIFLLGIWIEDLSLWSEHFGVVVIILWQQVWNFYLLLRRSPTILPYILGLGWDIYIGYCSRNIRNRSKRQNLEHKRRSRENFVHLLRSQLIGICCFIIFIWSNYYYYYYCGYGLLTWPFVWAFFLI